MLISPALSAQSIAGRVLLSDSVTPAARVIVSARHSDGRVIRTLTTSSGTFELRVGVPGRYGVQVLRVGFAPTPLLTVDVRRDSTSSVVLVAATPPVTLSAVAVSDQRVCKISRDTGLAVSQIWEEARKALWGTVLTTSETPLTAEWMSFERVTDSTGRTVLEQRVQRERHSTRHAFRSAPADSLARVGYVVGAADVITFHAPDADVLLHDTFAATHCFGLRDSLPLAPDLIGLSFAPARERSGVRDITGVMWMDRKSAALRVLEFKYTGLPPVAPHLSGGGRIEFEVLAELGWMIRSWHARFPLMVAPRSASAPGLSQVRTGSFDPVVGRVAISGGELGRVARDDAVLLERPLPMLRLKLEQTGGPTPFAGATLFLQGTNVVERIGASGLVEVGPLPAGRYTARIEVSGADSLGAPLVEREVRARTGDHVDTLQVPHVQELIKKLCSQDSAWVGTGLLRGTALMQNGDRMADAKVQVSFMAVDPRAIKAGLVSTHAMTVETKTDERGQWRMCGIPRATDLVVTVAHRGQTARRRLRIDPARMYAVVDMQLTEASPPRFD